ncbi:hypothetical protein DUI87_32407 [Hirundo rustica rustica]|uniref:Uncharacterized protein n=1 Tax=Hirundo rustica rustica TaxID=333673 RepID=A0A3M0IS89_HIRRU|nr:hypothetical protein DUI87_32407 [Hirundo rustica rustica]
MAAPLLPALRAWAEAAARAEEAARAALAASGPLLDSLAALAAQVRAARRLPWDASPLGAFPELRARLWRKQRGAAEALLERLGERREELRAVRDAVAAAGAAVLRLYEERGPAELPAVLRRGPRCPSLADVLEGLQDVERYYRHLYLESKLLLQRITLDSLADVEALPQSWERILERYKEDSVVQDTLLKVSLFVENHREHATASSSPGLTLDDGSLPSLVLLSTAQTVSRLPGEGRMKNTKPSSQRSAAQFMESYKKPRIPFGDQAAPEREGFGM